MKLSFLPVTATLPRRRHRGLSKSVSPTDSRSAPVWRCGLWVVSPSPRRASTKPNSDFCGPWRRSPNVEQRSRPQEPRLTSPRSSRVNSRGKQRAIILRRPSWASKRLVHPSGLRRRAALPEHSRNHLRRPPGITHHHNRRRPEPITAPIRFEGALLLFHI